MAATDFVVFRLELRSVSTSRAVCSCRTRFHLIENCIEPKLSAPHAVTATMKHRLGREVTITVTARIAWMGLVCQVLIGMMLAFVLQALSLLVPHICCEIKTKIRSRFRSRRFQT